jgi:hypothetical protein
LPLKTGRNIEDEEIADFLNFIKTKTIWKKKLVFFSIKNRKEVVKFKNNFKEIFIFLG